MVTLAKVYPSVDFGLCMFCGQSGLSGAACSYGKDCPLIQWSIYFCIGLYLHFCHLVMFCCL